MATTKRGFGPIKDKSLIVKRKPADPNKKSKYTGKPMGTFTSPAPKRDYGGPTRDGGENKDGFRKFIVKGYEKYSKEQKLSRSKSRAGHPNVSIRKTPKRSY